MNFNRNSAVSYAHLYAIGGNITYPNLGDNDCTNFVSQCWKAGGIPITNEWHCYSAANITSAWGEVDAFAEYMTRNNYCYVSYDTDNLKLGDIVQLYNDENGWHHSMIITRIDQGLGGKVFYYSAHSNSRYDEPLTNATEMKRFLHLYGF